MKRKRRNRPPILTATRVASLKPSPNRIKDVGQRGLCLLITETQTGITRTWLHRFVFQGKDTCLTIGHFPQTSLEQARNDVRVQRELLSKGIDPRRAAPRRLVPITPRTVSAAAVGDKHSIEFLVQEYMDKFIRQRHKRPQYVQAILNKNVLPEWKGRDARSIKPREVVELIDKVLARKRPVMANRVGSLLGQLFRFGIHRAIVEDSPVKLLYRPGGQESARQRALSDQELTAFLIDPIKCTRFERLSRVIKVLLLTGQRRGELASAQWQHINFKTATWTVPAENAKTGVANLVPLSPWAVAELRALKVEAGSSPWVLPGKEPTQPVDAKLLTRGMAKCQERFAKQKIAEFTLHDLRRTCRTGLARLKIEPHIAERVLNHAQEKIAGTYDTHDYIDEKRAALEKWAEHLQSLT